MSSRDFKALFKLDIQAKTMRKDVKAFLDEQTEAYDWWQRQRHTVGRQYATKKQKADFWQEFSEKFPLATKYLKSFKRRSLKLTSVLIDMYLLPVKGDNRNDAFGCDYVNGLAGLFFPELDVKARERTLILEGEVWSSANILVFTYYIKKMLKARSVVLSDGYDKIELVKLRSNMRRLHAQAQKAYGQK